MCHHIITDSNCPQTLAWLLQWSCALCSLLPPPVGFQTAPRVAILKYNIKHVIAETQGLTHPKEISGAFYKVSWELDKALNLRQSILPNLKFLSPKLKLLAILMPSEGPRLPWIATMMWKILFTCYTIHLWSLVPCSGHRRGWFYPHLNAGLG